MMIPWTEIATTIVKLGSLIIKGKDLTDQIGKILRQQKQATSSDPALLAHLQQLERAVETQTQLNAQYNAQVELMRSAFENIQKSLRMMWVTIVAAMTLSLAAILVAVLRG